MFNKRSINKGKGQCVKLNIYNFNPLIRKRKYLSRKTDKRLDYASYKRNKWIASLMKTCPLLPLIQKRPSKTAMISHFTQSELAKILKCVKSNADHDRRKGNSPDRAGQGQLAEHPRDRVCHSTVKWKVHIHWDATSRKKPLQMGSRRQESNCSYLSKKQKKQKKQKKNTWGRSKYPLEIDRINMLQCICTMDYNTAIKYSNHSCRQQPGCFVVLFNEKKPENKAQSMNPFTKSS